jgi:hypothetical protein
LISLCCEIANTNHFSEAKPLTLLHCLPYTTQIDRNNVLPFRWEAGLARLYGHGPMNQVHISIRSSCIACDAGLTDATSTRLDQCHQAACPAPKCPTAPRFRDRIWCTRCSWCTNAQSQRGTSIARSTTDANIAKRPSRAGQSWMWIFVKIPPPSFSQVTRTGSSHEQTTNQTTNRGSPRTEPLPRWMP